MYIYYVILINIMLSEYICSIYIYIYIVNIYIYNIEITFIYLDSHYIYYIKMNNSQPHLF